MFFGLVKKIVKVNPIFILTLILFLTPFFWFKPGEMDLGGDGTRLYFYDPFSFLKNYSIYSIEPIGRGQINPGVHAYLIYVSFVLLLKSIVKSSFLVIGIFNGLKLSVGFLSIYFLVKEFIQGQNNKIKNFLLTEVPSIIAGIFYLVSTGSDKLIFFWNRAIPTHDQIFLNPLVSLLLLKYFLTKNKLYILAFFIITFIFSTNFAMIASPPFFAFYPLTAVFMTIYIVWIRKVKINIKEVLVGIIIFLGIQAFHLFSEIIGLFDKGSSVNTVVFKDIVNGGVNFFTAIRAEGKASLSFLLPSPVLQFRWTTFIAPLFIILGYLSQKKKSREIFLTSIFFLITFFFVTANVTNVGFEIYRKFFYIPGFSIFRHFFEQWAFVFIFFYALLFGQCISIVFARLKIKYVRISAFIVIIFFVLGFWNFLNGSLIDPVQWGSRNVKTALVMDQRYEQTLEVVRKLPDEGKILILPLTSFFHEIVYGTNNAAYVGPSPISFLTSKEAFAGYQNFDDYPYSISENIMKLSREKNYEALSQVFSLFNIRYVLHNTDPKVYEEKFPLFPNDYMMTSLPKTQAEYKKFLQHFPIKMIYKNGPYELYEFNKNVYRKEIYSPDSLYVGDMLSIVSGKKISFQSAFIENEICKNKSISAICENNYIAPKVNITFKKNNPTQYFVHINQIKSISPFILVFQNRYNTNWKLLFDNMVIDNNSHIRINKYANGWIITNADHNGKNDYTIELVLDSQKYFWYGSFLSAASLLIVLFFAAVKFLKKYVKN